MPLPNFKQITFPCTVTKDTPRHPGPNWSSFSLTCDRAPIPLPFSHQALTHWFSLLPWNSLILILGPSYFLFLPPGRPFLLLPTFPSGLSTNAIPQEAQENQEGPKRPRTPMMLLSQPLQQTWTYIYIYIYFCLYILSLYIYFVYIYILTYIYIFGQNIYIYFFTALTTLCTCFLVYSLSSPTRL